MTNSMTSKSSNSAVKVAWASFVGTAIEWYDFYLYGTAAALVFGKLFFPALDPLAGTMAAFAAFAAGFVVRPIGGIVFGHFGDRIGRKSMLVTSLLLMGISTVLVGCLPTYAQIGIWAPILLVLLRLIQGFAVGGEWGGAALMAVEHAPAHRRGLAGSATQAGSPAGLLLSTIAFAAFSMLPQDQFLAWGWRMPFLLSAVMVIIGLVIRLKISESPEFTAVQAENATRKLPIVETLKTQPLNVVLAIGACFAPFASFYLFATFIITYATTTLGYDRNSILVVVSVAAAVQLIAIPLFAALSDRIGRRKVYLTGAVAAAVYILPYFLIIENVHSIWVLGIATVFGLAIIQSSMYAIISALFVEMFPAEVRYTGASLGFQFGGMFAGGFTPMILTALLSSGLAGAVAIPAYIVFMCIVSFTCVSIATRRIRSRQVATTSTSFASSIK